MEDLKSKSLAELGSLNLPRFKIREIFVFLHRKLKDDLSEFTTLSLTERDLLQKDCYISKIIPLRVQKGRQVEKVCFRLKDDKLIEAVLMDYAKGQQTLCVSSQAGCPVGCRFCATGRMGFGRNLSPAEILSQVYYFAKSHKISNLVFMGMGEPFLNYENVMRAAKILNSSLGQNLAARKITLSTIGIPAGIKKFNREPYQFRLAWSLVSPFDEIRKKLIPFVNLAPLEQIVKSLREYKRRITVEYVVLKDVNDRLEDVIEVKKLLRGLKVHINLISYNSIPDFSFQTGNVEKFISELKQAGFNVTLRKNLGREIAAACGQLACLDGKAGLPSLNF